MLLGSCQAGLSDTLRAVLSTRSPSVAHGVPSPFLGTTCVSPVPGGLPKLPPGPQLSHPWQGVKEFKCEVCGREFTLQANMKRHMLIHTSVRPYQCHICFKTFVQKQTLKTHMIVHSPVKPFKCKVPAGLGG